MAQTTPTRQLLTPLEKQLILGHKISDAEASDELAQYLSEAQYTKVLTSDKAKQVFGTTSSIDEPDFAPKDLVQYIDTNVAKYVKSHGPESWRTITWIGASCLNAFVQTNLTGPDLDLDPAAILPEPLSQKWRENFIVAKTEELPEDAPRHEVGRREQKGRVYLGAEQSEPRAELDRFLLSALEADGEEAYTLTPRPLYLFLALRLLIDIPAQIDIETRDSVVGSARWWGARALVVQQGLLEYPTQTLFDRTKEHFDSVRRYLPDAPAEEAVGDEARAEPQEDGMVPEFEDEAPGNKRSAISTADAGEWSEVRAGDREVWERFSMELGIAFSTYHMNLDSKRQFSRAQAASGLQWEITGAKGKRTRFQQRDLAQLVLIAKSAAKSQRNTKRTGGGPENMALDDDTLLENIEFTDSERDLGSQDELDVLDQCVLLAFCLNVQNENPAHGLTSEQMMPFVTRVLQHPSNWSVYTMALLLRSRLESTKTRTVERSTLQLQALVDQIANPLPEAAEAGARERMQFIYALSLPSQWELERELAKQFMSLGVVRSALDIFERLHMWDEAIACYQMLGQEEVAERIIREQLEEFPNRAKLWCILGDLKQEPQHWQHAWEVSGRRYARAMRALGAYHFSHNEFGKAVESYQRALKLNPMFERSWYVLGCAAIKAQDWEAAEEAFRRVVSIDNENAEAWNNLASIYMRDEKGSKERAWYALREALKAKFDSWQIWSNFMVISMSLGQISSAIHAMNRIIDLRADKDGAECIDLEILRAIINSVIRGQIVQGLSEKAAKTKEQQYSRYLDHLLVNVIEARITSTAPLWRAMADYWFWRKDYVHCLDCYVKAYRSISQRAEIGYAQAVFDDAVEAALELVDMYESFGDKTQTVRVATSEDPDQELPQADGDGGQDERRKSAAVSQPVCKDWKHNSKMLLRGLIGKGKESFEGTPNYERLVEKLSELRNL